MAEPHLILWILDWIDDCVQRLELDAGQRGHRTLAARALSLLLLTAQARAQEHILKVVLSYSCTYFILSSCSSLHTYIYGTIVPIVPRGSSKHVEVQTVATGTAGSAVCLIVLSGLCSPQSTYNNNISFSPHHNDNHNSSSQGEWFISGSSYQVHMFYSCRCWASWWFYSCRCWAS